MAQDPAPRPTRPGAPAGISAGAASNAPSGTSPAAPSGPELADLAAQATGADRHPRDRPTLAGADKPSEAVKTGLPDVGAGASATHFARDAGALQQADEDDRGDGPGTSDKRSP